MVERLLKEVGGSPSADLAEKLLSSIDRARFQTADKREQALGWKLRDVCLDTTGAFPQALEAYGNALQLDPKIGVKRRADQLRKIVQEGRSVPSVT